MGKLKEAWSLLKQTWAEFSEDQGGIFAAALSYSTLFAIAPLLLVAILVAGLVLGHQAAEAQVMQVVTQAAGPDIAAQVVSLLQSSNRLASSSGVVATVVALVSLLLGASGIVGLLRTVLDTMWGVGLKPGVGGIVYTIKQRLAAIVLVLGSGALVILTVVASTVLTALNATIGALPGGDLLWQGLNLVLSFAIITVVFAALFKFVPDVEIAWRDLWLGAAVTSVLFTIGKVALGYYLGRGSISSAYGAAGSLVALLVWVYYTAQIFLLGAEFTQVYAKRHGASFRPAANAVLWARRHAAERPQEQAAQH